jgi:hypothetical protein
MKKITGTSEAERWRKLQERRKRNAEPVKVVPLPELVSFKFKTGGKS